jgi:TolB-like protein/Tfp pilus assembly protein PilF/predicted Ser/Thr protein kinase
MIGKTISKYKILEKLGEGGMGVVYKAEDTELQRVVALKFLPAQALENDEERERFMHEARAAASIDHANVCTVYEIGKDEGRTFISMAYVEGRGLKEVVDSGPMRLGEAIDLAVQMGEGLAAAHEKGVVHRDVKPANVVLTPKGQAKIMDFGLAKSSRGVVVTQESTTLGTVAYMSPEQARSEPVDARTDIYSLGALLYEMVTGRRPFEGDYDQAVIYSILNAQPEPVTALRTGVPLELERVILRCLEKDPGDRYQTAADLVSDLRRAGRELREVTAAGAPSAVSGAGRDAGVGSGISGAAEGAGYAEASGISGRGAAAARSRSTRRWPLAVGLVVLAAIAVIILRPYFAPPAKVDFEPPAPSEPAGDRTPSTFAEAGSDAAADTRTMIVILPFENLGPPENAYFADGMTEEITSRLACVKALGVISRTSAVQYDRTGKTMRQIGEDLGVDYVLEGTVRWDGSMSGESKVRVTPQLIRVSDDTHLWADSYDRELQDIFSVQSDIASQVVEQLGVTLLEPERGAIHTRPTENLDAYHAYLRGMEMIGGLDPLLRNSGPAIERFEEAVALDPNFALAYAEMSRLHSAHSHFGVDRSEERLNSAREAAERALALAPGRAEPHIAMGYYYYWGLQEYDKALEEFVAAEAIRPNDPRAIEAEGLILRRIGRFEESLDRLERAYVLDPRDASLVYSIGGTLDALRRHEEAIPYFEESIALAPEQELVYGSIAECIWRSTGDLSESRKWLERMGRSTGLMNVWFWLTQELYERDYEAALRTVESYEAPPNLFAWYYAPRPLLEAEVYGFLGEASMARACYDSTRVLLEGYLETDPENYSVYASLAQAYAGLDRKKDAIAYVEKALELDPILNDTFDRPLILWMVAVVYATLGEYELALDYLENLLEIPNGETAMTLRLDPRWDRLRDSPRFKAALAKYDAEHGTAR